MTLPTPPDGYSFRCVRLSSRKSYHVGELIGEVGDGMTIANALHAAALRTILVTAVAERIDGSGGIMTSALRGGEWEPWVERKAGQ